MKKKKLFVSVILLIALLVSDESAAVAAAEMPVLSDGGMVSESEMQLETEEEGDTTEISDETAEKVEETESIKETETIEGTEAIEEAEAIEETEEVAAYAAEPLSLSIEYPADIKCGMPVTFTMNARGGSGTYKYRIHSLFNSELKSVYDVSYGSNGSYRDSNQFTFTFYASGVYYIRFSVIDMSTYETKDTGLYEYKLDIQDDNYPSVDQIVSDVTAQCETECTTDFEKALWLHDWIIDHANYDYSYTYCAPEGVLARGKGTCESYHSAYCMLLNKVGIATGRIEGNGHVWTAVKMDGEWYQIDSTWDDMGDDYKDTIYEHMYFGLTDEIISYVHSDHKVAVPGYESTALADNYFIKTGEIRQWSDPFIDTIRQKINNGQTEFVLPVTSSMPDNYSNVIYNLVAYQLSKENWETKALNVTYGSGQLTFKVTDKAQMYASVTAAPVMNETAYHIVVQNVSETGGIKEVQVAVWSDKGGQDDLIWYTAAPDTKGSYEVNVPVVNHKTEGMYYAHAYVVNQQNQKRYIGGTTFTVSSPRVTVRPMAPGRYLLTLEGLAAYSSDITGVSFVVWGQSDGQNDLRWYTASADQTGKWQAEISVADHGENGIYYVSAYTRRKNGTNTCMVATAFQHTESVSVQSIEVKNVDASAGTFDVFVKGVKADCGVESVQLPIWSKSDQSDIVWYTAWRQSDGSYATQVNLKNHNYNYALYQIHVYVTSGTHIKTFAGLTSVRIEKPQISMRAVLSTDEMKCSLTARNVAVGMGYKKIYFAVWSELGGQDDLHWYEADQAYVGTWGKEIAIASHRTQGKYQVHLYGEDAGGNRTILGTTIFSVSNVTVQSIKVKNLNRTTGTFDVFLYGIESASGLEKVQIPVWSKADQSDLIWYTAWRQSDGSYATQVNIRNHGSCRGNYTVHTYVTGKNGVRMFTGATRASIVNAP